jgi:hypothetical protein
MEVLYLSRRLAHVLGGSFPSGIKCLTCAYPNKEEYTNINKNSAWVAHLDKQKKNTKHVPYFSARNGIKMDQK